MLWYERSIVFLILISQISFLNEDEQNWTHGKFCVY